MTRFGVSLLGAAGLVAAASIGQANAAAIVPNGSLGIGDGAVTLAPTTNILPGLTTKSIASFTLSSIGGNLGTSSGTTGVTVGATVTFTSSTIPIPTTIGPPPITTSEMVQVGTVTFDFTSEERTSLVAGRPARLMALSQSAFWAPSPTAAGPFRPRPARCRRLVPGGGDTDSRGDLFRGARGAWCSIKSPRAGLLGAAWLGPRRLRLAPPPPQGLVSLVISSPKRRLRAPFLYARGGSEQPRRPGAVVKNSDRPWLSVRARAAGLS